MNTIIRTEKLTKKFGELVAVHGIDLNILQGEVFGLLGPNGAGKTTFISMLSTLIKPSSGSGSVAGFEISKNSLEVRKQIGIVFQEPSVDDLLTGRENLELHAMLYGMKFPERKQRIKDMLELVELSDRADSFVKTYSGGMRRRLEVARGLLHSPKVLFLDEPTLGLDPASRKVIWNYIKNLALAKNTTIILTTHYMEEADFLCDRIGIIDRGKIIEIGKPEELKRKVGQDIVILEGNVDIERLKRLEFVKNIKASNGRVGETTAWCATPFTQIGTGGKHIVLGVGAGDPRLPITGMASGRGARVEITVTDVPANLQVLLNNSGKIDRVEIRKVTLDDVFLKFTGHQIKDEETQDSMFERMVLAKTNRK